MAKVLHEVGSQQLPEDKVVDKDLLTEFSHKIEHEMAEVLLLNLAIDINLDENSRKDGLLEQGNPLKEFPQFCTTEPPLLKSIKSSNDMLLILVITASPKELPIIFLDQHRKIPLVFTAKYGSIVCLD